MTFKTEKIISLPKILDKRGNLSFFENDKQIPFKIKRTYLINNVPGGEERGGHAFKKSQEFIIALSGSFDVVLSDGEKEIIYSLNRSYQGLYVPNMLWRRLENFSTNSLVLITSSIAYDDNDYIRDFIDFKTLRNEEK
ncbi:TDP-4-oxo-6-deoxy-alpha-D-glucose-3,4-oxoisomerase [Polaribacter huanghezhanensis]|uniref:sugar 3,4-ketoisomerase n=1 Tax=Polaribacter huanghezhanensis TaxID=1354726 RepID=UPI00264A267F|nr:FdtA/QdtA family cupin domain-containing protein [Polaribacter huanghezhanensis]WKD86107.1 TDP-4-oxo-6-deoxy-alpha-D-glucose-3,4-oxoisomerase [Polaribacter huanghezhanensis]